MQKKEIGGKKKGGKNIQRVKTGKDSDKEDKNRQRRKWDLENENGQKRKGIETVETGGKRYENVPKKLIKRTEMGKKRGGNR